MRMTSHIILSSRPVDSLLQVPFGQNLELESASVFDSAVLPLQALRHSLLKAELRLKALRQRRNGGGASHPAESQRCTAPKAWAWQPSQKEL